MRTGILIFIGLISLNITGCKDGGCYYTCCISEDDCLSECVSGIKNAENCAIKAQEDCMEGEDGYLIRVQWAEVNGAFCENCASPVCAPAWWEANIAKESDTDTEAPSTDEP
ncbi:MAG: hypothetical protein JXX14_18425 [Deltaproteobacteria bacterium]|nr:hypothetical protein [Deltaproteobacteria bacterium]